MKHGRALFFLRIASSPHGVRQCRSWPCSCGKEDGVNDVIHGIEPNHRGDGGNDAGRSEEHTSELQSPCNLVCRLLLEKKKKIKLSLVFRKTHKITSTKRSNNNNNIKDVQHIRKIQREIKLKIYTQIVWH